MMNPLLARFAATPSLVAPEMRDWFEGCLTAAAGHARMPEMLLEQAQADDGFWPAFDDWRAAYRPYVVRDGILHIPVKGVLLNGFTFALGSWATGYVYIRRAFDRGMADPDVRGIALVCDSPGGHVAGCFDLVDHMFAGRATKPVRAFAHEGAYSAAYLIASVASTITVSRTGGVGSIGVVGTHIDVSAAMDAAGIKISFIFAGARKIDGNAYEALPDDVRARIQTRIDYLYGILVASVARNREMGERAVRATEAGCFSADEATANGLADAIGSFDDAMAAFAADVIPDDTGEEDMSETTGGGSSAATTPPAPTADTGLSRADAAAIAKACVDGGVPAMAATLLAEGVTLDQANARIGAATQIKDMVALARRADASIPADQADTFLAEGKTVEQARTALFDRLVAKQEKTEVRSHVPTPTGDHGGVQTATANMRRLLERSGAVKKGG